jgi:transposase-like protein
MTCTRCQHHECKRFGTYGKRKVQRWRCNSCSATFADPNSPKLIGTHYTDPAKAAQAIGLMLEGMSLRAISRVTGLHKQTILSLMLTASEKARKLLDAKVQNIDPKYVQMDELWGYVHTKENNLGADDPGEWGDAYHPVPCFLRTRLHQNSALNRYWCCDTFKHEIPVGGLLDADFERRPLDQR